MPSPSARAFIFPATRPRTLDTLTGGPRPGSRAYRRLVLAGSILIGSRQRTARVGGTAASARGDTWTQKTSDLPVSRGGGREGFLSLSPVCSE